MTNPASALPSLAILGAGRHTQKHILKSLGVFAKAQENPLQVLILSGDEGSSNLGFDFSSMDFPLKPLSYKDFLRDSSLDQVYVATPNRSHYALVKELLQGGKHVLCEKPLTLSFPETLELVELSRQKKRMLTEGFAYLCHPQMTLLLERIKNLGSLQLIKTWIHYAPKDSNHRQRLVSEGGIWADVGCYLINFLLQLVNEEDLGTRMVLREPSKEGEGDENVSLMIALKQGGVFFAHVSLNSPRSQGLEIQGSRGSLKLETPFVEIPQKTILKEFDERGRQTLYKFQEKESVYTRQFRLFFENIAEERYNEGSALETSRLAERLWKEAISP